MSGECPVCHNSGSVLALLDRQGGGAAVHVICPLGCEAGRRRMAEQGIRDPSQDFQAETRNQAVLK